MHTHGRYQLPGALETGSWGTGGSKGRRGGVSWGGGGASTGGEGKRGSLEGWGGTRHRHTARVAAPLPAWDFRPPPTTPGSGSSTSSLTSPNPLQLERTRGPVASALTTAQGRSLQQHSGLGPPSAFVLGKVGACGSRLALLGAGMLAALWLRPLGSTRLWVGL